MAPKQPNIPDFKPVMATGAASLSLVIFIFGSCASEGHILIITIYTALFSFRIHPACINATYFCFSCKHPFIGETFLQQTCFLKPFILWSQFAHRNLVNSCVLEKAISHQRTFSRPFSFAKN